MACLGFVTKVTFINEMVSTCKKRDIDISVVAKGLGFDNRICSKFLNSYRIKEMRRIRFKYYPVGRFSVEFSC